MSAETLSPTGRRLLDRRRFFDEAGTGLGSIALAALLAAEGNLQAAEPIRPQWSPDRPYAPRPPHARPAATQALVIFCSGALSHVDTWDYKPELIKRHDQPLPAGGEKLVTFQGENGNLVRSPWAFRPRGESGKMISDLLPNLADL